MSGSLYVRTPNEQVFNLVQKMALDAGWKWDGTGNGKLQMPPKCFCIGIYIDRSMGAFQHTGFPTTDSLSELIAFLNQEPPIKAGEYEVEFNKDGSLKVGCTTIDSATVERIVKRRAEVMG